MDNLLEVKLPLAILDIFTRGFFLVTHLGNLNAGSPLPATPLSILGLKSQFWQSDCILLEMGIQAINYVPSFLKYATKVTTNFSTFFVFIISKTYPTNPIRLFRCYCSLQAGLLSWSDLSQQCWDITMPPLQLIQHHLSCPGNFDVISNWLHGFSVPLDYILHSPSESFKHLSVPLGGHAPQAWMRRKHRHVWIADLSIRGVLNLWTSLFTKRLGNGSINRRFEWHRHFQWW